MSSTNQSHHLRIANSAAQTIIFIDILPKFRRVNHSFHRQVTNSAGQTLVIIYELPIQARQTYSSSPSYQVSSSKKHGLYRRVAKSASQTSKRFFGGIGDIFRTSSVKRGFDSLALNVVPDKPVQSTQAYHGRHFPLF